VRHILFTLLVLVFPLSSQAQTFGPYAEETYIECKPAKPTHQAIVLIHGNWSTGSARQSNILQLCHAFAAKGIHAFDINYRMVYAANWPAMFQDVQTAIRWVRSRGFTKVGAGGTSSGGTLSLMAGALDHTTVSPATDPQGEAALYTEFSPKADYVVDISGPTDTQVEDQIKQSGRILEGIPLRPAIAAATVSPLPYIDGTMSPTIIFQGTLDKPVPAMMVNELLHVFKNKGVAYQVQYYRAGHVFTGLPTVNESACIDEAIEFAKFLKPRTSNYPMCEGPVVK
jgi:acetyl esterase/lipase